MKQTTASSMSIKWAELNFSDAASIGSIARTEPDVEAESDQRVLTMTRQQ